MSTADTVEADTAAPFTALGWLGRLCSKSSSDAGSGGRNKWVCSCGHDFGDGSALNAAIAQEHELSADHNKPLLLRPPDKSSVGQQKQNADSSSNSDKQRDSRITSGQKTPFPYMPMLAIMASMVSQQVVQMSVFAYAGYMVEYLGVVDDKDKAGYYAGFLSSAFMMGRLFSSHFWGALGDRYSRRFVLLVGLSSTVLLSVAFGFSTSFVWAFTSRFLIGLLNGVTVTAKTLVSEVCGKEHDTVGMGVMPISWSLGAVLGPGIGGLMAEPAKHYPEIFSEFGIFGRYPYLLPNVAAVGWALLALPLVVIFIKDGNHSQCGDESKVQDSMELGRPVTECPVDGSYQSIVTTPLPCGILDGRTSSLSPSKERMVPWCRYGRNPDHHDDDDDHDHDHDHDDDDDTDFGGEESTASRASKVVPVRVTSHAGTGRKAVLVQAETTRLTANAGSKTNGPAAEVAVKRGRNGGDDVEPTTSLLSQQNIRALIFIDSAYSFALSGFDEVFTLWSLSTVAKGGLDWSTLQIGQVFLACGCMVLSFDMVAVPQLTPRLGIRTSQRIGSAILVPVYMVIPMLSNVNAAGLPVKPFALVLLFTCYVCSHSFYVGLSLAVNNATKPDRRGELNGISMVFSSLARSVSPVVCSMLFAYSIDGDHPFPFDYHFVFYLLASTRLAVACMGWNRIKDV